MRGKSAQPPAWFVEDGRYSRLNCADEDTASRLWLNALNGCVALRGLCLEDARTLAELEGKELPTDGRPFTDAFRLIPWIVPPGAVAEHDQPLMSNRPALQVTLYLDAPDAMIIEGVENALTRVRLTHPSPVAKPGPKALNGRLTLKTFTRWWKARIVEVAELDWWAARQSQRISNEQLAQWVFGDEVDQPNRKISEARDCLDKAIACRPALRVQCAQMSD